MNGYHEAKSMLRELFAQTMLELDLDRALSRVGSRVEAFVADGNAGREAPPKLVAFGKAAVPMTRWFLDHAGLITVDGVLSAPDTGNTDVPGLRLYDGGHPVPNEGSLGAGAAALELARAADGGQTVVFLISGGGSALLESPVRASIGLDDVKRLNRALVSCGADIVEMNAVRKHLSAIKGGRLAEAAWPARQLTIYVSDVPRGQDASVASGPTMPDESTLHDMQRVVSAYRLEPELPAPILSLLGDPTLPETPKPGDPCFARSRWICALENQHAIDAATRLARERGWRAEVDTTVDDIGVAVAAERLLGRLSRLRASSGDKPACVVSGGELSSPVRGDGTGGRNQAFVLNCVERIDGQRVAVLSAGTDGIDGNSPAAGAVADGSSLERARSLGLDPVDHDERSDSYTFFKQLGDDVTCGATLNNVRDIRVLVSWP